MSLSTLAGTCRRALRHTVAVTTPLALHLPAAKLLQPLVSAFDTCRGHHQPTVADVSKFSFKNLVAWLWQSALGKALP